MGSLDSQSFWLGARPSSDGDLTSRDVGPDNIREKGDRKEVEESVKAKQPSQTVDTVNLRTVSMDVALDPDAKPAVRVTMMAEPKRSDGFMFDPIQFELVEGGSSIRFARIPQKYKTDAVAMKEPLRVLFKNKTVTRGSHAQMWCEDGKVFVQDAGSSAGTLLNEHILADKAYTVSIPHRIESGSILQLGKDYNKADRDDTLDPHLYKCVRALVLIENIVPLEGKNQERTPKVQEQPKMELEPKTVSITFDCQPYCSCPWRTLFHEKGIYSLDLSLSGPETISSAVESWFSRHPNDEKWGDWKEADAVMMMSVIECIIETVKSSTVDVVQCQSWIRKIARHTGALPVTLVLKGVKRTSEHVVSGGGFADIYMGQYDGKEVALKVLRVFVTQETKKKVFREMIHEALFWKHLDHPHILPFLGISKDAIVPRLCLVSPWMTNGDILSYIGSHSEVDRLSLITQCSHGLRYLHEYNPGLVHGDIKGVNILIDEDGNARITDFGLITITETQALATSFTANLERGSVPWMAPELLRSATRKNRSTDVYAFGMTVLEIYTNSRPFANYTNDVQVMIAITRGARPSRPDLEGIQMYGDLWTLINKCWDPNPDDRPSMREVADNLDSLLTLRARDLLSFASKSASRPSLNPFRNLQAFPSDISVASSDTQITQFNSVYSDLSGSDSPES